MFQFVGYSMFSGPDCLTSAPSKVDEVKSGTITNAIFDHVTFTRDVKEEITPEIDEYWDYDTILNAGLNGNLNGGNVDFLINQVSAIKIKRRIKGTFEWLTLSTIPIEKVEDLTFLFIDRLNVSDTEYEYALVPILEKNEGDYLIDSIFSQLRGVFIGDLETTFKFMFDVSYGTNARNQQTGTFLPLGKQYPVIVANGVLGYDSGTVMGAVINPDFMETKQLDTKAIIERKEALKAFLTNKKAKLLRDWNGNCWLCCIVNSPGITYREGSSMQIPLVSFEWTQVGDHNSQLDLYYNGVVNSPN